MRRGIGRTSQVEKERQERREGVIAVYQVLNGRYGSNTTLQWQVPLYVFPVQAALIVGINAAEGPLALVLGLVAVLLGVAGAPVMWWIQWIARWDRQALDEFESVLLAPPDSDLRLMHAAKFDQRLKAKPLAMDGSRAQRLAAPYILKYFRPSRTISLLMVVVGLTAGGMGVQKWVDGTSEDPPQDSPRSMLVRSEIVYSRTL